MAGAREKIPWKKSKQNAQNGQDWSRSGTFINKPTRGWIHPDEQLSCDAGVSYGVRYIGCMEVKISMKTLDFESRTAVAKESISKVCDAAGLKTASKKSKKDKKVQKYLGDQPNMSYAGANVNLTITTETLVLMIMETGELIATHPMPGISFASGGDPDTMDFVAYVAKDSVNGRACHVLECGGGLAQDVITTIGQAFELRFKEYIKNQPKAVNLPDRLENPIFNDKEKSAWGDDPEYYNDRPGVRAPSPTRPSIPPLPQYAAPSSNLPVSDGIYSSIKRPKAPPTDTPPNDESVLYDNKEGLEVAVGTLIDLSDDIQFKQNDIYDNPKSNNDYSTPPSGVVPVTKDDPCLYDNKKNEKQLDEVPDNIYDNNETNSDSAEDTKPSLDAFNMQPFNSSFPDQEEDTELSNTPEGEEWFHGVLARKQAEALLKNDGDFLVRESSNSPGQYVLSGRKNGHMKHLLLVDPEGVVRTKDRTFDSVSHLVTYHLTNNLPIMSQESELILTTPIINSQC